MKSLSWNLIARRALRAAGLAGLAAGWLLLAGCNTYYVPPAPIQITLTPIAPTLNIITLDSDNNPQPSTIQFTADVINFQHTDAVTWAVGQNGVYLPGGDAQLGYINADGVYTAPALLPSSPVSTSSIVVVECTSVEDPNQTATMSIVLFNPAANLTAINPPVVVQGKSYTLTLSGQYFFPTSTVQLSGAQLGTTTYVSPSEIQVQAQITAGGVLPLSVVNPNEYNATNSLPLRSLPATPTNSGVIAITYDKVSNGQNGSVVEGNKAYIPNGNELAVVNLDANVQIASVALPTGFVAEEAAANPAQNQIVVVSASGGTIVLVDSTHDVVSQAYTVNVSGTATFNGQSCQICGLLVDASRDEALLDTASGFMTVNLATGVAGATIAAPPAANFAYDAVNQRIFAPFQQGSQSGLNVINLAAGTSYGTVLTGFVNYGTDPAAASFDAGTDLLVVGDGAGTPYLTLNFNSATVSGTTFDVPSGTFTTTNGCAGPWYASSIDVTGHFGWFANDGGCTAVAILPQSPTTGTPGQPSVIRWAQMPLGPDGLAWASSALGQPIALAVYTGSDGNTYGLALRQDNTLLVKMNLNEMLVANQPVSPIDVDEVDPTNVTQVLATSAGNSTTTVSALGYIAIH